ncbi:MAG: hypothetical protein Fur0037_28650 [Planctomycetota bacterium]
MAALAAGSLFLDEGARRILSSWTMPRVGLLTFAFGISWVALFLGYRIRTLADRLRVFEDRLDRLGRRADAIEDAERARRALP